MVKSINIISFICIFAAFIFSLSHKSQLPVFLFYSWTRIFLLLALLALLFYIYWSLQRTKLAEWNVVVILCVGGFFCSLEVALRVWIEKFPYPLVQLLPYEAKVTYSARVGNFTASSIRGEGLLYYFPPNFLIKEYPFVKIDQFGYRNPTDLQQGAEIDAVVLGDSVTFARNSKYDLGDYLRAKGLSAYNFGMSGYSASHYPLVLKKMVIERGVKFRHLIIGVYLVNDIRETEKFIWHANAGGDYASYLGGAAPPSNLRTSWAIELFYSSVLNLKGVYFDRPNEKQNNLTKCAQTIRPGYTSLRRLQP